MNHMCLRCKAATIDRETGICSICGEDGRDANRPHYGNAMIAHLPDGITITIDCISCGRLVIGPVSVTHLSSVAEMINGMVDALGLPPSFQVKVEELTPKSPEHMASILKEFDNRPLLSKDEVLESLKDDWKDE